MTTRPTIALAAALLAGAFTAAPALADENRERAARCAPSAELCETRRFEAPRPELSRDRDERPRIGFDAPVMSGPFGSFT